MDRVFIGSCTNSRMEDLRAAAKVVKGYHISPTVSAMVVPGSWEIKQQAEKEGLDKVFLSRIRLARSRMLDVPGHESRYACSPESGARPPAIAILKDGRVVAGALTW